MRNKNKLIRHEFVVHEPELADILAKAAMNLRPKSIFIERTRLSVTVEGFPKSIFDLGFDYCNLLNEYLKNQQHGK